jgi:nucleoside-diphosphate-sugar epimerase
VIITEESNWDISIDENGDFSKASGFDLYHAEKLLADQVTREFIQEKKPHFAVVTMHPGFIYGHNVMQLTAAELSGTNGMLFNSIMNNVPISLAASVHVQDVADAHLRALAPEIKHGSKYLLVGPKYTWSDVVDVLKKYYANAPWKLDANTPTGDWDRDTSKAEKELSIKWKTVEEQVRSVMDQQLSLRKASA